MNFAKKAGIFLLFVIGFWAISAMYLSPAIGGEKALIQGDMQQTRLMRAEMDSFKVRYGEYPGWSDGLFGGMPTTMITGIPSGNLVYKSGIMELFHQVSTPFNFLFLAMLSMFVLLISSGVNRWLAAAGGIGYAFMTYSITSYEAGHITKVLAMDLLPGVLAGLVLLNQKKYWLGGAVLGIFFTLLIGYFHYQVAYYAGIIAGIFLLVEVIRALMAKESKHAIVMGGLGVLFLATGALSNIGKIIDTAAYSKATMRGGSEVASEVPKNGPKTQVSSKGLEREYAFAWSYSPEESMTVLVPRIAGGSSNEGIGENEITNDDSRLPLYHGDLTFTSGPVYIGAVFLLLFTLGIVSVAYLAKSNPAQYSVAKGIMWFSVITTAVSFMLAWGRFFPVNNFLFDNLPYYNKFRTPMMALSIAQMVVPFFGLYALQLLLNAEDNEAIKNKIFKTGGIAAGGLLVLAALLIMGSSNESARDAQLKNSGWPAEAINKLKDLRGTAAWQDWARSLAFMGLSFGLVWWVSVKKQSKTILWVGILLLVSIDMVGVSKRYLNDDNWEYKDAEEAITPTPKDAELMKFNTNHARVFDLRYDPFNDAHSAPWHRSIGGYHPAKLSRYQDIISYCITPNGGQLSFDNIMKNNALDMLNCGFVMSMSDDRKQEQVIPRSTALGNAWFVSKVLYVPNAKAALEAINQFKPGSEVVVEEKEQVKPSQETYTVDSSANVSIKNYGLDTVFYSVSNSAKGLAVFSEVYYNEKNGAWKAYIDGKETPIIRVNYVLRGVEIPAGAKEVKMVYNKQVNQYFTVEAATSGLLLLLLVFTVGKSLLSKDEEPENA